MAKGVNSASSAEGWNGNASSGQIFVTIAPDHFGPILEDHDPKRNLCKVWGAHFPHVARTEDRSTHNSQSVALSRVYLDI
uniref:Uncharacterized protein n=1 Tax=Oryza barthii TaxID=65489 RepID=A0A0D3FTT7_9ORYZ